MIRTITDAAKTALSTSAALLAVLAFAGGAEAADIAAGKAKYDMFCTTCHGPGGKGDGPVGQSLNPKPRDFTTGNWKIDTDGDGTPGSDTDLRAVIENGAGQYGGSPMMAPWGGTMSDDDVKNVIAFIRSLKE